METNRLSVRDVMPLVRRTVAGGTRSGAVLAGGTDRATAHHQVEANGAALKLDQVALSDHLGYRAALEALRTVEDRRVVARTAGEPPDVVAGLDEQLARRQQELAARSLEAERALVARVADEHLGFVTAIHRAREAFTRALDQHQEYVRQLQTTLTAPHTPPGLEGRMEALLYGGMV
jgi:hypothetical protein